MIIINYTILISIVCTIVTSVIAILNYKNSISHNNSKDIFNRVKWDTTFSTKLDMLISSNIDLKKEIKNINDKFDSVNERVVRCEERTNIFDSRINKIESVFKNEI